MINNIPTYVIGCDELPERKQSALNQLQENNIQFQYWRGLYGKSSGISTTIPNSYWPDGRPYYGRPSNLSLCLNHLFLYQHCLLNNHDQVVILEDDFQLTNDWKERMTNMIQVLPADYDMVYLGWIHEGHNRKLKHFADCLHNQIDDCIFGTHALLISKNGLKILADNTRILQKPIDIQIYESSIPKMKYYLCLPCIITQKSQSQNQDQIWKIKS